MEQAAVKPETRTYVVRVNCEYRQNVEATSEDEAIEIAERLDLEKWNQAWSEAEAEVE